MLRDMRRSLAQALLGCGVLACQARLAIVASAAPSASVNRSATSLSSARALPSAPVNAPASPASTSAVSAEPASPATWEGAIGQSGPLVLRRAALNASWVTFCQPRLDTDGNGRVELTLGPRAELRGDALGSFFASAAGEQGLGVLLMAAPGDRFLAFWKEGTTTIIDSAGDRGFSLAPDADVRFSAETLEWVRTLAFDPTGTQLVYLRRHDSAERLVVRGLLDGAERELEPGGVVWRVRFDASGKYLLVDLLSDTNRSGKLEPPAPALAVPPACLPAGSGYHVWVGRGDRVRRVWLPLDGGKLDESQNVVLALKNALVVRDPNGALLALRGTKLAQLEPAECKGRIVFADLERSLLLVGCAQKKKTGRVSLELVDLAGKKQPLGAELASVELDREPSSGARLVPLYPGADSALFDLETRSLLPLKPGDAVLGTLGAHALVRRGSTLVLYDAEAHAERALPGSVDKFPELFRAGAYVFVSPLLVELTAGSVVGSSKQRPLALAQSGLLLLSEDNPSASASLPVEGPLHWRAAAPAVP